MSIPKFSQIYPSKTLGLPTVILAALAAAIGDASAQNLVQNGAFTANASSFTNYPGYCNDGINPGSISGGWSIFTGGNWGINGAGVGFSPTGPFGPANDGGNTYAFLQNTPGNIVGVVEYLTLVTSTEYEISFDVAARSGETDTYRLTVGDNNGGWYTTQVSNYTVDVTCQGASFVHHSATFTSGSTFNGTPNIQLYNLQSGTTTNATVNFANVTLLTVTGDLITANPLAMYAQSGVPDTRMIIGGQFAPSDSKGNTLTVTALTAPAHGTATTDGKNVTYTSTASYTGSDSFNYVVGDGLTTATNTINVTVSLVLVLPSQNIVNNGNFTANAAAFINYPGYCNDGVNPGTIAGGWFTFLGGEQGLNGAAVGFTPGAPYAPSNDGGYTYAFVQTPFGGGTPVVLAQYLTLAYNTQYQLAFETASEAADTGDLFRVQINDSTGSLVTTQIGTSDLTNNSSAFTPYLYTFSTPAAINGSPSIQMYNLTPGSAVTTEDFANVSVVQPPVASTLAMGAESGVPATLKIIGGQSAPLDPYGYPLTVTAVGTPTNGTASTDGVNVTYTSTAGYRGNDSFTYTVGDGQGTATAKVNVIVVDNANFNQFATPGRVVAGQAALTYYGVPDSNYALDQTTSLSAPIHWIPVITNAAASNGSVLFTVTASAPMNFFRARHVP